MHFKPEINLDEWIYTYRKENDVVTRHVQNSCFGK